MINNKVIKTRLDLCRKSSNEATNPSCTDLDTVDVDAELEIVPTSPLPEPQFLSNPDSTPVKYPTLGMVHFYSFIINFVYPSFSQS